MPFLLIGALIVGLGALVATQAQSSTSPSLTSTRRQSSGGGQGQAGAGGFGNTGADTVGTDMRDRGDFGNFMGERGDHGSSFFLSPFGGGPDVGSLPIPNSTPLGGGSMTVGPLPFAPTAPVPQTPLVAPAYSAAPGASFFYPNATTTPRVDTSTGVSAPGVPGVDALGNPGTWSTDPSGAAFFTPGHP